MWYAALVAALILITIAALPRAAKARSGTDYTHKGANKPFTSPLKIATFNIQAGKDINGQRNLDRVAKVIQDNDIVGVQEVYAPSWLNRLGLGQSQSETLAHQGAFNALFCATRRRWFKDHRGNAIFSQFACNGWQIKNLVGGDNKKTMRNMTIVQFSSAEAHFVFINTHITTKAKKHQQIQEVLTEFNQHQHAILVGDFNLDANDPLLQNYLCNSNAIDAIAAANIIETGKRIDWILCKGFNVQSGSTLPAGISDHPYYQLVLEYRHQFNNT